MICPAYVMFWWVVAMGPFMPIVYWPVSIPASVRPR
jgi:hypothetical protein